MISRKQKKKKNTRTCFECGKVGHSKAHCYQYLDRMRRERESFPSAHNRQQRVWRSPDRKSAGHRHNDRASTSSESHSRRTHHHSEREKFPAERANVALLANSQQAAGRKKVGKYTIPLVVDSSATEHIVNDEKVLKDCWAIDPVTISTAKDGEVVIGKKRGVLKLSPVLKSMAKYRKFELYDVLFIPNLQCNLLSVSKLVSTGFAVHFCKYGVEITDSYGNSVASGKKVGGLFVIDAVIDTEDDGNAFVSKKDCSPKVWHSRLGHLSWDGMKKLASKKMAVGFEIQPSCEEKFEICEPCAMGKQTRKSFKRCGIRSSRPLEVIHSDVCGPMSESTYDGYRYFVVFVDDFTHFVVVYLMRNKDEVLQKFRNNGLCSF